MEIGEGTMKESPGPAVISVSRGSDGTHGDSRTEREQAGRKPERASRSSGPPASHLVLPEVFRRQVLQDIGPLLGLFVLDFRLP
jgi:hypothetical protein